MVDVPTFCQPELVIFDMAGTTVEDRGQVPAAFGAALSECGIQVSAQQIRRVRGAAKRQAIRSLIPEGNGREGLVERAYAVFISRLKALYAGGGVQEMAGASQVIRRLRRRGLRVALNTGFDQDVTGFLLEALGWNSGLVDAVVCGDDVAHGRPAPDMILRAMEIAGVASPAGVANVGDTLLDLEAGYRADVGWNIGVLSGAHDRATLESQPYATHILSSVVEVAALFQ